MNVSNINIITYTKSPLQAIMPLFQIQENIFIFDEKNKPCFDNMQCFELWIDGYVDLYDPCLINPEYLYHFFLRIHQILDKIDLTKISAVRMLRNFPYDSTYIPLKRIFSLYQSLAEFFQVSYSIHSVFVPDIIHSFYEFHPYHSMMHDKKYDLLWNQNSCFRIIHPNDVVYHLMDMNLEKNSVALSGVRINLLDMCMMMKKIFGIWPKNFDEAYMISIQDDLKCDFFSDIHYNLEDIFMSQLS